MVNFIHDALLARMQVNIPSCPVPTPERESISRQRLMLAFHNTF